MARRASRVDENQAEIVREFRAHGIKVQDLSAVGGRAFSGAGDMNPLAEMWARRELERLERKRLRQLMIELREANKKAEPLRQEASERHKAGIKGDGFVMRPVK